MELLLLYVFIFASVGMLMVIAYKDGDGDIY